MSHNVPQPQASAEYILVLVDRYAAAVATNARGERGDEIAAATYSGVARTPDECRHDRRLASAAYEALVVAVHTTVPCPVPRPCNRPMSLLEDDDDWQACVLLCTDEPRCVWSPEASAARGRR